MAAASTNKKVGDYDIDIDPATSLGKGTFGSVYVGCHARSGKDVAAKLLECNKDFVTEMDQEANLMKSISEHPNILQIIDYIKQDMVKKNNVQGWLILELCVLGNVREFAQKKALTIAQKVDLILQGSLGLQHLHSLKPSVIHHDIKLENLLVDGSEDNPVVKVGDFGISKFFAHTRDQSVTERVREGTPWYLAPELYRLGKDNKPEFNKAVDVFAMAISALTLVEEKHGQRIQTYTVGVGKDKKGLGKHIHEENVTDVAALIRKSGDSEEVKRFKSIIAPMLVQDRLARLTIHAVVDRLTQLRSELGILNIQLDTVWIPAKLLADVTERQVTSEEPGTPLHTDKPDPINPSTRDPELRLQEVKVQMESMIEKMQRQNRDDLESLLQNTIHVYEYERELRGQAKGLTPAAAHLVHLQAGHVMSTFFILLEEWGLSDRLHWALYSNLRDICWNYADESHELCVQFGEARLLEVWTEELKRLHATYRDSAFTERIVNTALGTIHNCAKVEVNRTLLRRYHFVEAAQPYTDSSHNADNIVVKAVLTISYLIEENETSIVKINQGTMSTLVNTLQIAIQGDQHRSPDGWHADEICDGLAKLAAEHNNLMLAVELGAPGLFAKLLIHANDHHERLVALKALDAHACPESCQVLAKQDLVLPALESAKQGAESPDVREKAAQVHQRLTSLLNEPMLSRTRRIVTSFFRYPALN